MRFYCTRHNQTTYTIQTEKGNVQSEWCSTCDIAAQHFPFDAHYKDHPTAIERREVHRQDVQRILNKSQIPPKRRYSNKPS